MKISPILLLGVGALALVVTGKKKTTAAAPKVDPVIQVYQINLNVLGYYPGPMDGAMNDGFKSAIVSFQTDAGIPTTGILDPATREGIVASVKLKGYVAQVGALANTYGGGLSKLLEGIFG